MGVTRIPAVGPDKAGPLTRILYWYMKRRFGVVPEPFAVAANHPGIFLASSIHEGLVERASTVLPANIREIAVYQVARTVGCSWCVDFGTMLMRLDDLDIDKLRFIDDYRTHPAYSEDERAAIAYADAVTATPPTVTDEQVTDLKRRFGSKGVMELTYQIALENSRARGYHALGITDQGFSQDSCRVPWA
ncbi:carboxymuconolactone decarboxylase family protein [Nocardia sp. NBC_01503]|uniref:carboxymuconolactone decarboxylase family protein n=1 Tax=Nocardia sp. NBC_01503 TaxID=2975997 RepID=UPI002E7AEF69|nr:carboxymuconolactone decarboxylase family protein [Nocardia sp. NBC_01503]WTL33200.1 carboxymuconolactone decarboxylase family protein [Nocardia sp. NBC_01503]